MAAIKHLWTAFGRYDRVCGVLTALALFGLILTLHSDSDEEFFRLIQTHPWASGVGGLWTVVLCVRLGWDIPYGTMRQ